MKASRLLTVATLIILAALPLAAQVNDTYIIPGAARANGLFGTRWLTQLSIFNPQLYTLRVVVVFMPTGGGVGDEVALDIPPNSLAFTDDLIGDVFAFNGVTGALLVATFPEDNPGVPNEVIARSFLVTSNTYNDSINGTYSQTIPGVWSGLQDYASDEISAVAHGVRHHAREGWRTNIGAVNLGRRSTTMRVKIFDGDGRLISTVPFVVPPLGHMLDQLPVEVNGGSLEFFVDDPSGEAVVFPAVSTIDQLSGDPRYQSPTLLASASILFSKGAQRAELGKRIDTTIARRVRSNARSLGVVQLKREVSGHRMIR